MLIGGIGSVTRFLVDRTVTRRIARPFPIGTLAVNISGAALLGFLGGLALSKDAALLAGTAFVGAYTTFSTWMLESSAARRRAPGLGGGRQYRRVRRAWCGRSVSRTMAGGAAMNQPCLKLTAYFGERQRAVGDDARFLADALFDVFGST